MADQYVHGAGETATFTCLYPPDVSSYVQIRSWFADKQQAKPSQNLVIHDVQREHSTKLYYCIVVNILTKEIVASNVARLFIKDASGNSLYATPKISQLDYLTVSHFRN